MLQMSLPRSLDNFVTIPNKIWFHLIGFMHRDINSLCVIGDSTPESRRNNNNNKGSKIKTYILNVIRTYNDDLYIRRTRL